MAKNMQNLPYRQGHIDWSFESGPWFGYEPSADNVNSTRGIKNSLWFLGDDEDGPMVVCVEMPPNTTGYVTAAHSHASDQVRIMVSGSFRIGNDWYKAGDIRFQEAGKIYGPEEVGPEGCRFILVFSKRSAVVADYVGTGKEAGTEQFLKLIAEMSKATAA